MAVFATRQGAEDFVAGDPFVRSGVVRRYEIREWNDILGWHTAPPNCGPGYSATGANSVASAASSRLLTAREPCRAMSW